MRRKLELRANGYRTDATTSLRMAAVRPRDTSPERLVRQLLTQMGWRYRLHRSDLPGKPDLVLPSARKVIFVHGCFWHRHRCARATTPARNLRLWLDKFAKNVARDRRHRRELRRLGWQVLVLWECQLANEAGVRQRLERFLDKDG
jgi:DNA mismatch endonuclease (patch repair protein)